MNEPVQPGLEATVYAGRGQGNNPGYSSAAASLSPASSAGQYEMPPIAYGPPPTSPVPPVPPAPPASSYAPAPAAQSAYNMPQQVYAPPPYAANGYGGFGGPQVNNGANPPVQQKKPRRGKLWLILGALAGFLLIAAIVFGVIGYANRSTATKTLNAFCAALKGGDYQTAYNQLSSGLQAKFGSEAAFAQAYSSNEGLGRITSCTVTSVDDGANMGTILYTFAQIYEHKVAVDYTLIDENNVMKINGQHPRSTPALTLTTYCTGITQQDYQTAYNQLAASLQSQIGSEAQFVSFVTGDNIKGCVASDMNDVRGTGLVTYIRGDGNRTSAEATMSNPQGVWKINILQTIPTPTETLLTYCGALKAQDYQTAYNQLSSSAQSQETEAQFAANFNTATVSDCKVSNVNDTAGTGSITYTLSNGASGTFDYTLVNENNAWKINSEQQHA